MTWCLWACSEFSGARSVTRRGLSGRAQCLEKRHECSRLRGTQVFSVGWHVAAALDHLANELILRELYSDSIQIWATLSAGAAQRMAVVALLRLKNERPLPLQGRAPFQVCAGIGSPLHASITGLHGA